MFRRLTPSRSAYGGLSEACVPFGIWGLLKSPYGSPSKGAPCSTYRSLSDLSESVPCSAYGGLSKHAFFAALAENAVMGPDCMNLGTCCQETPRWGLLSGRYSSDFFPENYVTWPFVELSCFVRAFAGFSFVMRSAERPPCRVFCHLGLETLRGAVFL